MEIDEVWKKFCEDMAEIELIRRLARDTTRMAQNEINRLDAEPPEIVSAHNMHFHSAQNCGKISYGKVKFDLEGRSRQLNLLENKQYQWLLAEAWERFEIFVGSVYAYLGQSDSDAWPLRDYGNVLYKELEDKPFEWYQEQAKSKERCSH